MSDAKYEKFECWQYLRQAPGVAAIEQSKAFEGKKWVWAPDPTPESTEGYFACTIDKQDGDTLVLKTKDGKVSF